MKRSRMLGAAVSAAAVVAGAAACGSPAVSHPPASASAAVTRVAAAVAPSPTATTAPDAACEGLAAWESGGGDTKLDTDTALQREFAETDDSLSSDFAVWISDIKSKSSEASMMGAQVSRDCLGYDVRIFPSSWDSPSPAPRKASHSAAPAHSATPSTAAPSSTQAAGPTVSEQNALTSAEGYLSDGTGFSRQGLIDQLDSSAGEGFPVADAIWAVDHSDADWDAQAVISAKGYMSDGSGFSRSGLIEQLTSSAGEGFTYAQAVYAVGKVGL